MTFALDVNNLRKVYDNDFAALKGVSFQVKKGDFFALLGPNGAGKSTTLSIISSLIDKTSGEVSVYGHSLESETAAVKRCLGLVPQEFNFHVFEKVEDIVITQAGFYGIPRSVARERAEKYLKKLDLWDKRENQAGTLSGGMKRRLMIARALVHEPQLLILDEPTAGVDVELRRSMWAFLKEINDAGTTIILTTHYLEEAEQLCRNIAIIADGNIIQNTSMPALLKQLNKETLVLDLHADVEPSLLTNVEGYDLTFIDSLTLEVEIEKGNSLNALFTQLTELGIEVNSMRSRSNRLEELFISLVEQKD